MRKLTPLILLALAACASSPPAPPPQAFGPVAKINTDEEALTELIRAARAGLPRQTRYTADRGDDVRRVLSTWTRQAKMRLEWNTKTQLSTIGGIDEPDIRAAVLALAVQLKDENNTLMVEFPDKATVVVSDFPNK
jgi:DNA repair photolyase